MPPDYLIGAISVSRTTMDTARIAGALSGAGLLAALGMGPADVAIVSLYLVSTLLTLRVVAPSKPHLVEELAGDALRSSPLRDLKEGVAHVWTSPRMRAAIWIAFLANLTAYPLSNGLLPYIARDIYGTNQTGLGCLSASFAVGSHCEISPPVLSITAMCCRGSEMVCSDRSVSQCLRFRNSVGVVDAKYTSGIDQPVTVFDVKEVVANWSSNASLTCTFRLLSR